MATIIDELMKLCGTFDVPCSNYEAAEMAVPTIATLLSDLKAKDAELTSLKAENEALKEACDKVWDIVQAEIKTTDPESPEGQTVRRIFSKMVIDPTPISGEDRARAFAEMKASGLLDRLEGEALSQSKTEVGG